MINRFGFFTKLYRFNIKTRMIEKKTYIDRLSMSLGQNHLLCNYYGRNRTQVLP